MSLFRSLTFSRRPLLPDRFQEISERVYVFDCCLSAKELSEDEYRSHIDIAVANLQKHHAGASFMVFNFKEGEDPSLLSDLLAQHEMTVVDYPRHNEGYPIPPLEMIHYFLRSSESWLSLEGQKNVILMHCERGAWPVLAFMLAGLVLYNKKQSGEQKALEMMCKKAPKDLLTRLSAINPRPSQIRYLKYISERSLISEWPPSDAPLVIDSLVLMNPPLFDGGKGFRPAVHVYGQGPTKNSKRPKLLFSSLMTEEPARYYDKEECLLVNLGINCRVQGDVFLECIHLGEDLVTEEKVFKVMFHTAFVQSCILSLGADEVDVLWNPKIKLPNDFKAEVFFSTFEEVKLSVAREVESSKGVQSSIASEVEKSQEVQLSADREVVSSEKAQLGVASEVVSSEEVQLNIANEVVKSNEVQLSVAREVLSFEEAQSSVASEVASSKEVQSSVDNDVAIFEDAQLSAGSKVASSKEVQLSVTREVASSKEVQPSTVSAVEKSQEVQLSVDREVVSFEKAQSGVSSEAVSSKEVQLSVADEVEKSQEVHLSVDREVVSSEMAQSSVASEVASSKEVQLSSDNDVASFEDAQLSAASKAASSKEDQLSVAREVASSKEVQPSTVSEVEKSQEVQLSVDREVVSFEKAQLGVSSEVVSSKEVQLSIADEVEKSQEVHLSVDREVVSSEMAQLGAAKVASSKEVQPSTASEVEKSQEVHLSIDREVMSSEKAQLGVFSEVVSSKVVQLSVADEVKESEEVQLSYGSEFASLEEAQLRVTSELASSAEVQLSVAREVASPKEVQPSSISEVAKSEGVQLSNGHDVASCEESRSSVASEVVSANEFQISVAREVKESEKVQLSVGSEVASFEEAQLSVASEVPDSKSVQSSVACEVASSELVQSSVASEEDSSELVQLSVAREVVSSEEVQQTVAREVVCSEDFRVTSEMESSKEVKSSVVGGVVSSEEIRLSVASKGVSDYEGNESDNEFFEAEEFETADVEEHKIDKLITREGKSVEVYEDRQSNANSVENFMYVDDLIYSDVETSFDDKAYDGSESYQAPKFDDYEGSDADENIHGDTAGVDNGTSVVYGSREECESEHYKTESDIEASDGKNGSVVAAERSQEAGSEAASLQTWYTPSVYSQEIVVVGGDEDGSEPDSSEAGSETKIMSENVFEHEESKDGLETYSSKVSLEIKNTSKTTFVVEENQEEDNSEACPLKPETEAIVLSKNTIVEGDEVGSNETTLEARFESNVVGVQGTCLDPNIVGNELASETSPSATRSEAQIMIENIGVLKGSKHNVEEETYSGARSKPNIVKEIDPSEVAFGPNIFAIQGIEDSSAETSSSEAGSETNVINQKNPAMEGSECSSEATSSETGSELKNAGKVFLVAEEGNGDDKSEAASSEAGSEISTVSRQIPVIAHSSKEQDVKVVIEPKKTGFTPQVVQHKKNRRKPRLADVVAKVTMQRRIVSMWVPRAKEASPENSIPKPPVYKWVPKESGATSEEP